MSKDPKITPQGSLCAWAWSDSACKLAHIDYFARFGGQFLVVWKEAVLLYFINETSQKWRSLFATSDKKCQYPTTALQLNLARLLRWTHMAPYHRASNGQTKRALQMAKTGLFKQDRRLYGKRRPQPFNSQITYQDKLMCRHHFRIGLDRLKPDI